MKKKTRIGAWIFSVFLFTGVLVYMPSVTSFIFLALGIVNLPIRVMDSLWDKILKGKHFVKVIIVAIIFMIGCGLAPQIETSKDVAAIEPSFSSMMKSTTVSIKRLSFSCFSHVSLASLE